MKHLDKRFLADAGIQADPDLVLAGEHYDDYSDLIDDEEMGNEEYLATVCDRQASQIRELIEESAKYRERAERYRWWMHTLIGAFAMSLYCFWVAVTR